MTATRSGAANGTSNGHGGTPRVVIAGAGMSGMLMGIRLKAAGFEDFTIHEKAAEVGGTWRENRYPGLSCDVPAHYYTYTFEPNPDWAHRFARGPDIQRYMQSVADKYDLRRHMRFESELVQGRHDGSRWHLQTRDGGTDSADVLVAATGVLHHPAYPPIEGLDEFAGDCFHSARWPENLDLTGKRVGLIGTGSTGVQIATELGRRGHDLTVFQRTAQWIFPWPDRPYGRLDRGLARRVPGLMRAIYKLYQLGWERGFSHAVVNRSSLRYKLIERVVRWNLHRVRDPELRRKLTPSYAPMCKRMILSWDYYRSMQKPNVGVVTEDIEHVVPEGVITRDGKLHELDVLVLATGFRAHDYLRPMDLENADGHSLSEAWAERPHAHRTVGVPGFPNFFLILGPKTPIANYSVISISETQTSYIIDCIRRLARGEATTMTPRADVAEQLDAELEGDMADTAWVSGCSNWYLDDRGIPDTWPSTPSRYRDYMRRPDPAEFELR